jgi:hypothetical protein
MLRIAKLETFADEFVCFVKLTTEAGNTGWGQTSTYNADITAQVFHRQVAPWALGAGALEIGNTASKVLKGNLQPEIRILPAILVKQLTKTPSPDGSVKTGMIRMRSVPTPEKVELAEKSYADFRKQSDPADRNPEIFIFAAYFELREFDKLEALLKLLGERSPKDPELKALIDLYAGAIKNARELLSK